MASEWNTPTDTNLIVSSQNNATLTSPESIGTDSTNNSGNNSVSTSTNPASTGSNVGADSGSANSETTISTGTTSLTQNSSTGDIQNHQDTDSDDTSPSDTAQTEDKLDDTESKSETEVITEPAQTETTEQEGLNLENIQMDTELETDTEQAVEEEQEDTVSEDETELTGTGETAETDDTADEDSDVLSEDTAAADMQSAVESTYASSVISIPITKIVKGNPSEDEEFLYLITDAANSKMKGLAYTVGAGVTAANINCSGLEEGTYTYRIYEVEDEDAIDAGWYYDSNDWTVTFTVSGSKEGEITVLKKNGKTADISSGISFTNRYDSGPGESSEENIMKPETDKNIVKDGTLVKTNTAAIGDTVQFRLSVTVPDDYRDYSSYDCIFKDTLSKGLTFMESTLHVYIDSTDSTPLSTGYTLTSTVNEDGTTSLAIQFSDLTTMDALQEGSIILVQYDTVVNENANTGAEGNTNKMIVYYYGRETGAVTTTTYVPDTAAIQINKVDEEGEPLKNAQFTISGTNLSQVTAQGQNMQCTENGNGTEISSAVEVDDTGVLAFDTNSE